MKKMLGIVLLALVAVSFGFAEGQQDDGKFIVGLSQESLDHPMMIAQREQVMKAAEKYPPMSA